MAHDVLHMVCLGGPTLVDLEELFAIISTHNLRKDSLGQIPLGPSLGKQNIQAKEVYRWSDA